MTAYEDNLLSARFAAVAPDPLPGDWADVVARAGVARKSSPPLKHSGAFRHRRFVVALAVVALVAVVTATAIGGAREFILDRGFLGLAPEGATPSSPEEGELVLHYLGRSASHGKGIARPLVQKWVYADGRMIWAEESGHSSKPPPEGANELVSGYLEQRLTPEGIELLRSEVAELVDRSRDLIETVPVDRDQLAGPSGSLALFTRGLDRIPEASVDLREGDRLVSLHWMPIGGHGPRFEGTMATPEQLSALRRIDALLTDGDSVLPASAWAVRKIRAYVPSHYAACFFPPPKDQSQALSLLPTAAADQFRDKSPRREDVFSEYCFKLTTEGARAVAASLSGFKRDTEAQGSRLAYQLRDEEGLPEAKLIYFEPYFPHGQITCSACG